MCIFRILGVNLLLYRYPSAYLPSIVACIMFQNTVGMPLSVLRCLKKQFSFVEFWVYSYYFLCVVLYVLCVLLPVPPCLDSPNISFISSLFILLWLIFCVSVSPIFRYIDYSGWYAHASFFFFFWSGLRGPKAYSLWGGVVPSLSIGYDYL